MRTARVIMLHAALASLVLLLAACPGGKDPATTERVEAGTLQDTGGPEPSLTPSEPIPADEPLLEHAGLRLGMGAVEIAQVYNAPEGKGDGFTRVIEDFGDISNQIIAFDITGEEPDRRIVASLYRDRLFILVDRRNGISGEQVDAWRGSLFERYGTEASETINGAQWAWQLPGGAQATFTQDNASSKVMDAHLMLSHPPTRTAARNYMRIWEEQYGDGESTPAGAAGR